METAKYCEISEILSNSRQRIVFNRVAALYFASRARLLKKTPPRLYPAARLHALLPLVASTKRLISASVPEYLTDHGM